MKVLLWDQCVFSGVTSLMYIPYAILDLMGNGKIYKLLKNIVYVYIQTFKFKEMGAHGSFQLI